MPEDKFEWTDELVHDFYLDYINNNRSFTKAVEKFKSSKMRKPLLTTYNGVDVYEGDWCRAVNKEDFRTTSFKASKAGEHDGSLNDWVYFSTTEAAEEWVVMNKPCLSISNVESLLVIRKDSWQLRDLKYWVQDIINKQNV